MKTLVTTLLLTASTIASASDLPADFDMRLISLEGKMQAIAHLAGKCQINVQVYGNEGLLKDECVKFRGKQSAIKNVSDECQALASIADKYMKDNKTKLDDDFGARIELNRRYTKLKDSCLPNGRHMGELLSAMAVLQEY